MKKLLKLITLALACILMVGVIVGVSVAAESTADPTGLTVGGKNVHYQTKTLLCVSVKGVTAETEDDYAMLFWDYDPGTPNLETATVDKEIKVLEDSNGNEVPTTLAHLTDSAESEKLINGIKLSDVIDESTASPVIKSLLTTTDSNGNKVPTTLAHLTDPAESEKLINGIKLADVIQTDDKMLQSILYVNGDLNNPRTLGEFTGGGAQDIINGIKLADVLNINDKSHPALIFLAYGSNKVTDNPRTLGQIRTMGDDLINDIPLSYIITPDMNSTIVCYLIYGTKDIHYSLKTKVENGATVKYAEMLQRHIIIEGGKPYNEYGEAIGNSVGALNGTSTYTEFNGEGTEDDVTYNLTAGTRADGTAVYYLSKDGEAVLFTECTLKEFATDNNMLTKLTARLTAGDILGDEVNSNPMLKHLKDTPIDQLATAIKDLKFAQVFADKIYDEHGNLKNVWKYMLVENGVDKSSEYTVLNDMDKLVDNMIANVQTATLRDLRNDGILNFSSTMLDTKLILRVYTFEVKIDGVPASSLYGENTTLGDLTTQEMIAYIDGLLAELHNAGI